MKNILILHTGGTFGMRPMEPNQVLAPSNLQEELMKHLPEIAKIAHIDVEIPFNEDSSDLAISDWEMLAKVIHKKMDAYDGFVVIHGTDTMVYTATALSFSLLNLKKPVIFTGAQRPLAKLRSDARLNLIDAIEVATFELGEVLIVFGQRILRANRCRKHSIARYDAFYTPNYPELGSIELHVELAQKHLLYSAEPYLLNPGFDASFLSIHIHPDANPLFYNTVLNNNNIKAVLLIAFGAGNLPVLKKNWIRFIEELNHAGKKVFINSSSAHGSIELDLYKSGKMALDVGAIGCKDMTIEASVVKIMKCVHMAKKSNQIEELFNLNFAGESAV